MQKLVVVKIGSGIIDNEDFLEKTLQDFANIEVQKIMVHGGGSLATFYSKKLGLTPQLKDGRRITDAGTLKVTQMVYAGLLNKNIVTKLQYLNCNAIGLSGADANCLLADKRPKTNIDYGFVGDIKHVNSTIFSKLLALGLTPVLCSLTHDGSNQLLNTNADTIAAEVGSALTRYFNIDIYYLFENKGVLNNIADENSLIKKISKTTYLNLLASKKISEGMLPKLHTAFSALDRGVKNVYIAAYDSLNSIFEGNQTGTLLTLK
jgi:acetylglutamate kinase